MEQHLLLIVSFISIIIGFGISFDNRGPVFCMTLKTKYLCRKSSILHNLFPHKESKIFPHSIFLILPLFIGIIIFSIVLFLYILYWTTDVVIIESFIESKVSFAIGGFTFFAYFLYPIFLIVFNKIMEIREKMMSEEKYAHLQKEYDEYYKHINS